MVRTQVYLTEAEAKALRSKVAQTGKKQSELIREAVDQLIANSRTKDWRASLKKLAGIWKDRTDSPDFKQVRKSWNRNVWD